MKKVDMFVLPPTYTDYCENGGGVYGRTSIINNNLFIILWINKCNYHKYCLNYNFGYHVNVKIKLIEKFKIELIKYYKFLKQYRKLLMKN